MEKIADTEHKSTIRDYNSMLDIAKRLFTSAKKSKVDHQSDGMDNCMERKQHSISTEVEVNFIKTLLERKFNRKFQIRVRVEGFLGEKDMKYNLVIDDFCNDAIVLDHYSIYGYYTTNVLDVNRSFLAAYWNHVAEGQDGAYVENLSSWDVERVRKYRSMTVARSREELLMKAELEGII